MVRQYVVTGVRQGTPEWLALRRTGLAASEMPIVTGARGGVYDLWAYKAGLMDAPEPPPPDLAELFALGHALEPVIADAYTRRTGLKVLPVPRMLRARQHPWAFASLDRWTEARDRIVEIKWAAHRRWTDGVPVAVQDQVQWQMLVTGIPRTDVAVLNGGVLEVHEVAADPDHQAGLMRLAVAFMQMVADRTPPQIDGSEETRRALARVHPRATVADMIPATPAMDAEMASLRAIRRQITDLEATAAQVENGLRAAIGDHEGIEGFQFRATWTAPRGGGRTSWRDVVEDIRTSGPAEVGALIDEAIGRHTADNQPGRVLRVRWKDEETGKWM